ncbi:MAG TPA: universal stress protein [Solirubrobacteraceae bacterium]|nr:universal stress protein [Solirubrobacteraceae bacterium]
MSLATTDRSAVVQPAARRPRRIAAAVDGRSGGADAVALGAALARLAGADLLLTAIEPDLQTLLPGVAHRGPHEEIVRMLTDAGEHEGAPYRTLARTGPSVARGLEAVVREQRRDLLVMGSREGTAPGEVSIGHRTRALLHELGCPLAVAPAGMASASRAIRHIAVGYDGGPHAAGALALGAGLAREAGTTLTLCGVIDDRLPSLGWPQVWLGEILEAWQDVMAGEETDLREIATQALASLGIEAELRTPRGRPATALAELSQEADLLIIGSRRWGAPARVILGGTGEALAHSARCPLLVVPRPTRAFAAAR